MSERGRYRFICHQCPQSIFCDSYRGRFIIGRQFAVNTGTILLKNLLESFWFHDSTPPVIHKALEHVVLSLRGILPPDFVAEHHGLKLLAVAAAFGVVRIVVCLDYILACDLDTTIRQVLLNDCSLLSVTKC